MTRNEMVVTFESVIKTLEEVYLDLTPSDKKRIAKAIRLIEVTDIMYED